MAIANITLDNGTEINGIDVPEWMAPNVPDYLAAVAALQTAAAAFAVATADRAAADAEYNAKSHDFTLARQNVEAIMEQIMQNIGGQ